MIHMNTEWKLSSKRVHYGGGNKIRIMKFFRQHFEVTKQATLLPSNALEKKSLLRNLCVAERLIFTKWTKN